MSRSSCATPRSSSSCSMVLESLWIEGHQKTLPSALFKDPWNQRDRKENVWIWLAVESIKHLPSIKSFWASGNPVSACAHSWRFFSRERRPLSEGSSGFLWELQLRERQFCPENTRRTVFYCWSVLEIWRRASLNGQEGDVFWTGVSGQKEKEPLFVYECVLFSQRGDIKMCICFLFGRVPPPPRSFICDHLWFLHLSPTPTRSQQAIQVTHLLPTRTHTVWRMTQ